MPEPLVIRTRENGPLVIQGAIKVVDHLGNEFPLPTGKDTIALCRCGHSKNKPFCDGSHRNCGFMAAEIAKGSLGKQPALFEPATISSCDVTHGNVHSALFV